jgi:hypothetical protein
VSTRHCYCLFNSSVIGESFGIRLSNPILSIYAAKNSAPNGQDLINMQQGQFQIPSITIHNNLLNT